MTVAVETLSGTPRLAKVFLKAVVGGKKTGTTLPDTTLRIADVRVDRAHLLAYQRLCGFQAGDVLPHTYPHLLGFPLQAELMSRPGFPLTLAGLVHVENVITAHRSIRAEEVLEIAVRAENLRPHAKGRQVDLVAEARVADELVWDARSTYLARGRSSEEAERGEQPPPMPRGFPAASWSLSGGLGREYAAVSGDVNPIHLHPLTAKAMGFPRAIAHGMWTYARVLGALGTEAGGACRSQVWFRRPVLLPGRVELVVERAENGTIAGLRSARNQDTEHLVLRLTRR